MKKLLLILLCLPMIGFGQQTYVPDNNFEQHLINLGFDNILDDSVLTSNISNIGGINLSNKSISDLAGIEDFTSLIELYCGDNQLTSLDVSNNTALINLDCEYNQLTSLDLSTNTALTTLHCNTNQLTSLDLSNNLALAGLRCDDNQLTSLYVSVTTALTYLNCESNYIECLDISTNTALTDLNCSNNLLEQLTTKNGNWINNLSVNALNNNLTCVEVDNIGTATNDWSFDSFATLTTNCNYANPCTTVSSIQEHTTNKELLKVTDLLGRETKGTKNEVLFYIYDDGTVEKRIVKE